MTPTTSLFEAIEKKFKVKCHQLPPGKWAADLMMSKPVQKGWWHIDHLNRRKRWGCGWGLIEDLPGASNYYLCRNQK